LKFNQNPKENEEEPVPYILAEKRLPLPGPDIRRSEGFEEGAGYQQLSPEMLGAVQESV
jgi:hypothetical protein